MKIKEGFRMRPLGKEFIITGEGVAQIDFNKMIVLNGSAAWLWESFEKAPSFSVQDLADKLIERYGIDLETALKDSEAIAGKWVEAGIAEE